MSLRLYVVFYLAIMLSVYAEHRNRMAESAMQIAVRRADSQQLRREIRRKEVSLGIRITHTGNWED